MKTEVWNRCCRDLKTYLETALAGARGGVVSVKLNRVLEVGRAYMWKRQYAWCLSRLLHSYKFGAGLYVLTRQQAEELLNSLVDASCAGLDRRKTPKKPRREEPEPDPKREEPAAEAVLDDEERMPNVSFHLPRALLQALDEYARRMNLTRSDVIRMAIRQMLDKIRAAKETAEKEEEPEFAIAI